MSEDIAIGLADIPAYIDQLKAERDNALRYTELLITERDEAKAISCVCINAFKALQMAAEGKIDEETFVGVVESSAVEMGRAADWLKAYTDAAISRIVELEAKVLDAIKDRERLDWLQANYNVQNKFWYGERTLRDAVDMARSKERSA